MAEEALVGGDADPGALALAAEGVAPELPQLQRAWGDTAHHRTEVTASLLG